MSTTIAVRRAVLADGAPVWPLARDFATSFRPQRSAFEATFAGLINRDDTLVLVAEAANRGVVGYLLANQHGTFLANGPVVWVEEVMVRDDARREGLGRALMQAAEHWAATVGAAYVSLASRRAGDFYLRLGYEDSARFYKKSTMIPD